LVGLALTGRRYEDVISNSQSRPHHGSGGRWIVAGPVLQFALLGLAAVIIVGLATATASRRVGQREAVSDARTTALVKAQGVVEPVLSSGLVDGDPVSVRAVDQAVRHGVLDPSLVRVKIWRVDGTIIYSDEPRIIGSRYQLDADNIASLRSGLINASVSDLSSPENRYERSYGKLLEVYLPVRVPDGSRLLFEAYFRYAAVSASGRRIWSSFAPVTVGALVVLGLVQIPLAWSLARRLRQRQVERELLLHRSLEASDIERRRIATDLHDGVVQDLAGVALQLAAAANDTDREDGHTAMADAAGSLRRSITTLRSTLVEIYPPDLADAGLVAALADLVQDSSGDDLAVSLQTGSIPLGLNGPASALLYRAAREGLRNVQRHAHATSASVTAGQSKGRAWVEVVDNGVGFDPTILKSKAADGHVGLRGLTGLVRDAGGSVAIDSSPGSGTTVRVEVPTP
jgi:signal transduction histidine kinase